MRVLLMVTNVFFATSFVHAAHKRVIIRVPQRTKHIYHHQVKKVPVYVLLPEKKPKVLDDLEEVTKVLPCKERDREPLWQEDISSGPSPPSSSPSRYRYARHYGQNTRQELGFGLDDVDGYDATSIWQQETKRSLEQPPLSQRPRQWQRQQQSPRRFKSAGRLTDDHYRIDDGSVSTYRNGAKDDKNVAVVLTGSDGSNDKRSASEMIIRSSPYSSLSSLYRKAAPGDAITPSTFARHRQNSGSDSDSDRDRYYEYENDYKSSSQTKKTMAQAKSNALHDSGGYFANANRNTLASASVGTENLAETRENGNVVGQNLIRISYPPSASAPVTSFANTDSSFYRPSVRKATAAYDSSGTAATAADPAVFQLKLGRSQSRPQQSSTSFDQLPLPVIDDNHYASSYQYKIQH